MRPSNLCANHTTLAVGLGLLLLLTASAQAPASLVLNEILYHEDPANTDPVRAHEWVEIYNPTADDIDLSGWTLSDRDGLNGPGSRTLPAVALPADSYLVVHFTTGTDDLDFSDCCGEYYTGDSPGIDLFAAAMDETALYAADGTMVDFIAWNYGASGYLPGVAHQTAVATGIWTEDEFLNTAYISSRPGDRFRQVTAGTSIGRDRNSTDTDRPEDWDATGGRDAYDYTLCRQNLDQGLLVPFGGGGPPPAKEWTVMVYMTGDDGMLDGFLFPDLKEMERSGGSSPDVNVVVQVDSLGRMLESNPATAGGTWRFYVGNEVNPASVRMISHGGNTPFLGSPDPTTPPDVNMGSPGSLAAFINWAKTNYPARRYALILWGHGLGWKSVCPDESSAGMYDTDALYMTELKQALTGHHFEIIGFDACLMASIEVAYQLRQFGDYLFASEEVVPAAGLPYDLWLTSLVANPNLGTQAICTNLVTIADAVYVTASCTNLNQIGSLVGDVSSMAADLKQGCDDFQTHDSIPDNVERLIENAAEGAQRFDDQNFMDLHHFAQLINGQPIPDCYKTSVANVLTKSAPGGGVVVAEAHDFGDANGLHVYMPRLRTTPTPAGATPDPYDYPYASRVSDGNSQRALFAPNRTEDVFPFRARDVETGAALPAPGQWPLVPAPGFDFPSDTQWDEFLLRYYYPVSDNHILYAIPPDGGIIYPVVDDPDCGNPIDRITVPVGSTVFFSGVGSSDADTAGDQVRHWDWDLDNTVNGCTVCLAPDEVPPGSDAGYAADDDMNADGTKAPLDDEKESTSATPNKTYPQPGSYVVNLNVWDDNHQPAHEYHNTLPDAQYVHPQVDNHPSHVLVVPFGQLTVVSVQTAVTVGEIAAITVAVTTTETTPVTGAQIVFEQLYGDCFFLDGMVSDDGRQTTVWTEEDGTVTVHVVGDHPGEVVIELRVTGTELWEEWHLWIGEPGEVEPPIVEPPVGEPPIVEPPIVEPPIGEPGL